MDANVNALAAGRGRSQAERAHAQCRLTRPEKSTNSRWSAIKRLIPGL
jgi:hypothetical protein